MDCRQAQALVHAAIDNELDAASQLQFDDHLAGCAACSELRAAATRLHAAVGAADLYYRPPERLERRIVEAVRRTSRRGPAQWIGDAARALAVRRLGFAASAAAIVLALVLGVAIGRRTAPSPLVDELVDGHIRSLMPGHLTDEASSEHHTVKPWFAGRLDFSPAVPDLSAAGFLLAGARLDYAGSRPVAALVYRRRQHVINLFVWPRADGAAPKIAEGSRRGYNFVVGAAGSNEACAVSDLDASELRAFMRLVVQAK